jgi:hypothetical protein
MSGRRKNMTSFSVICKLLFPAVRECVYNATLTIVRGGGVEKVLLAGTCHDVSNSNHLEHLSFLGSGLRAEPVFGAN